MQILIDVLVALFVLGVLWWVGGVWVRGVWDKKVRRVVILDTYEEVMNYSYKNGATVIANLRDDGRWEVEL